MRDVAHHLHSQTDLRAHQRVGPRIMVRVEGVRAFVDRLVAEREPMIETEGPETVAAFVAEPVMSAGGVWRRPPTAFR